MLFQQLQYQLQQQLQHDVRSQEMNKTHGSQSLIHTLLYLFLTFQLDNIQSQCTRKSGFPSQPVSFSDWRDDRWKDERWRDDLWRNWRDGKWENKRPWEWHWNGYRKWLELRLHVIHLQNSEEKKQILYRDTLCCSVWDFFDSGCSMCSDTDLITII